MNRVSQRERAFSLVEVVIAIAVVTIGIISILALFGVSFTAVRDVTNQGEAYGVAQALPAYLQAAGFNTVYTNIQAGTATNIYAYCPTNIDTAVNATTANAYNSTNVSQMVIDTNGASDMTPTLYNQRSGRLFNISLTLSTNAPVALTGTAAPAYTGTATLPSSATPDTGYGDAYLPINVKIYSISQIPAPASMTNSPPVLNYDTTLSR